MIYSEGLWDGVLFPNVEIVIVREGKHLKVFDSEQECVRYYNTGYSIMDYAIACEERNVYDLWNYWKSEDAKPLPKMPQIEDYIRK